MDNKKFPQEGGGLQAPVVVPEFLTVKQYAEHFPWPTESGLRWAIFHAASNGLESALIRVGRRIIIDVPKFHEWIRSHRDGGLS